MSQYLSNPILRNWRTWLEEQFIADVPPKDAFCEFDCEKTQCQSAHWATCERRLANLAVSEGTKCLSGKILNRMNRL